MVSGDPSWVESAKIIGKQYVSHFLDSTTGDFSTVIASVLFGVSGIFPNSGLQKPLRIVALLIFVLALVYIFIDGRPFGVDVTFTPTHLVDGEREPDTMSENAGVVLIQNEPTLVYGTIKLSKFTRGFKFKFSTRRDTRVELQMKPRKEHQYDPSENILECDSPSDRSFPVKFEIYPVDDISSRGRYDYLKLKDESTGKALLEYQIIDASY